MTVDGTTLITGASAGIGEALAREFAKNGHDLVLVARREERLDELAADLERHGVETHVIVRDLALPGAAAQLYDETVDRNITVGVLVNNVGIGTQGPFIENNLNREVDQLQLNVVLPTQLTRLYGREMAERGGGSILNVASAAAWFPGPYMAVYYASKAYLKSFSEAIHEELRAEGVAVTALCPGPVRTEFQTRAENTHTPLGSGRMQDVGVVAQKGYAGLQKGTPVVVAGVQMELVTRLSNLLPNALTRRIARRLNTA